MKKVSSLERLPNKFLKSRVSEPTPHPSQEGNFEQRACTHTTAPLGEGPRVGCPIRKSLLAIVPKYQVAKFSFLNPQPSTLNSQP